ncbi:vacuole membrane protein 1 isoform X1 [Frankliniella occidentalis]|uniref:Vacuole membrane protein 1 isoform X1 n=2 Tax=Frankliniella occidentalis TaxID=133901 RepID=A0A6J1T7F5_FRAOC|nr:vacuole membrane protein 1 isoform X1 [Frankliniella occidentalis]XP_052127851.1 vacuole membrane protein 1 isoform X1 [Frankliniella occidentalis]
MVSKKNNATSSNKSKANAGEAAYLQSLNKEQLKRELKRRGIKTSGSKTELLQRLSHNMSAPLKRRTDSVPTSPLSSASLPENHHKANGDNNLVGMISSIDEKTRELEREERESLVLWRHPLKTLNFFCCELWINIYTYAHTLLKHRLTVFLTILVSAAFYVLYVIPGPHQQYMQAGKSEISWCLYWVGLGVLSSVGLGTGLHTFLLYLGPHIASVTLAAYECGGLNFPQPPYPDEIVCPSTVDPRWVASIWNIMSKVRVESFMWGAGTALGELPPYFMARAARLSGYDPDDEDDLAEFEELQRKKENPELLSTVDRLKLFVEKLVEKIGFFGILACASIPNPLFDLAGITCGHFLVPFWTFFGATLLGKAVIKMHIQKVFVIVAFNETLLAKAVDLLGSVPVVGPRLQQPFSAFLVKQKERLHRKGSESPSGSEGNLLSAIFEKFVVAMIIYFVVSIVNSLAQSYHKRLHSKSKKTTKKSKD